MPTFLQALSLQFYRGIGPETQYIVPLSDLNIFIGNNNAGKSAVLNFLHDRLPNDYNMDANRGLESVEQYRGKTTGNMSYAIGIPLPTFQQNVIDAYLDNRHALDAIKSDEFQKVFKALSEFDSIWLKQTQNFLDSTKNRMIFYGKKYEYATNIIVDDLAKLLPQTAQGYQVSWYRIWSLLIRSSGGSIRYWIPEVIEKLLQVQKLNVPEVVLVPAKRVLGPSGHDFEDQSGKGLIDKLAELQSPSHEMQELREDFRTINNFVRDVTGKPDAQIEVPHDRKHLLVHMDNKVLPLEALGTGIHEVVLIGAFCTIHKKKAVCIEEPEIHLHPVLQRKLIRYLQEHTNNQYFIATHSAAFIDTPGASIFKVDNDGVQTRIRLATKPQDKRAICDELGYRASDILQTNAVVWVEGPSDRIYLTHWLRAVAPELIEGVHFTIMFYGGSLISHLSADDEVLSDFISLKSLNRNMAVIIDSDRDKADAPLKEAAQRLKDELKADENSSSFVWITDGREVENYIDPDTLHGAIQEVHSRVYHSPYKTGKFDHSFYFRRKDPDTGSGLRGHKAIEKNTNKVAVATRVCEHPADLSIFDLETKVSELAHMIRKANGIEVTE